MINPKLIRITTVPISLSGLLEGQMKYMTSNGFEVLGVSSSGKALDDVARNEGVRVQAVEMTRTISPLKDLKALWRLYRLFRKEKPDIVHSHTPKAGTLGMIAAWMARVPLRLHTVAGLPLLETSGVKRLVLDIVEKITYACATKVYPNSIAMQDIVLRNRYTSARKLMVIGNGSSNGIDTSEFDPKLVSHEAKLALRKELKIKEDDFVFLFVGRVVTDKGVNELVDAFSNLNPSGTNSHLVIVGGYERELDHLLPEAEKMIDSQLNIHAVGTKKTVIDYFAMADLLTFPSYREGFPNVVMQAAAMQLNAIVTDINGCNEIITDGENGWIIPSKNSVLLRERMEWCLKNPEESRRMGLKSRPLMQEKFERKFVWEELLKEYRNLLKGKGLTTAPE